MRQPTLLGLAVSYSLYQLTWGPLSVVIPVFVAYHFATAAGSSVTGLLWAAVGVAGAVSALFAGICALPDASAMSWAARMVVTAFAAATGIG
ncbi:hypothetical protein [Sinorhizobium meliloti]|uniref:hypothetical protein n=1 Tax=Rhizobium meliloti TaxID=382 RepID=UPI0012686F2A|nr:hypothetical protein [Sinorhizobium meliloti]